MAKKNGNDEMNDALNELYRSGIYSDLTIKCGNYEFPVHKAIVCGRSSYFAVACKPNAFVEGKSHLITLTAADEDEEGLPEIGTVDPDAVRLLIQFIYRHDYDTLSLDGGQVAVTSPNAGRNEKPASDDYERPSIHVKMAQLSSMFGIPSLALTACEKFHDTLQHTRDTEELVKCLSYLYNYPDAFTRGFYDAVCQELWRRPQLMDVEDVKSTISSLPALAYDLLTYRRAHTELDAKLQLCNLCKVYKEERCPYISNRRNRCETILGICNCAQGRDKYCQTHGRLWG